MTLPRATLLDLAEWAGGATPGRTVYAVLMVQVLGGDAWTVRRDGELIAIGGLFPRPGNTAEAWLLAKPPPVSSRALAVAALQLRAVLRAEAPRFSAVKALVRPGNRAGERIAALLGLAPGAECNGLRDWEWRDEQLVRRRQEQGHDGDPATAIADGPTRARQGGGGGGGPAAGA